MESTIKEIAQEIAIQLRKELIDLINQKGTIPDFEKNDPKQSNLMNTSEAAEFYSVHVNTIRSWVKKGELKSIRKGNRLYIVQSN